MDLADALIGGLLVADAFQRLRASVAAEDPVKQIDGLITELEKLLKVA